MRAVKIPRLEGGSIGPSTESLVNWDVPMARDQKYTPLVGGITPLNCAGRHNTPSRGRQYRAQKGKLVNWDGPMTMVPCLQEILIPKGSYGYGETRNVFR